jgi:hypothetical protein
MPSMSFRLKAADSANSAKRARSHELRSMFGDVWWWWWSVRCRSGRREQRMWSQSRAGLVDTADGGNAFHERRFSVELKGVG